MITHFFFQAPGGGNPEEAIITFVLVKKGGETSRALSVARCRYSVGEDMETCIQKAKEWGNSANWIPHDCEEWIPYHAPRENIIW